MCEAPLVLSGLDENIKWMPRCGNRRTWRSFPHHCLCSDAAEMVNKRVSKDWQNGRMNACVLTWGCSCPCTLLMAAFWAPEHSSLILSIYALPPAVHQVVLKENARYSSDDLAWLLCIVEVLCVCSLLSQQWLCSSAAGPAIALWERHWVCVVAALQPESLTWVLGCFWGASVLPFRGRHVWWLARELCVPLTGLPEPAEQWLLREIWLNTSPPSRPGGRRVSSNYIWVSQLSQSGHQTTELVSSWWAVSSLLSQQASCPQAGWFLCFRAGRGPRSRDATTSWLHQGCPGPLPTACSGARMWWNPPGHASHLHSKLCLISIES